MCTNLESRGLCREPEMAIKVDAVDGIEEVRDIPRLRVTYTISSLEETGRKWKSS